MAAPITVRTNEKLREELERRAAELGISVSEVVHTILEEALMTSTVGDRTAHVKGQLALPRRPTDPWQRHLRRQNWRS